MKKVLTLVATVILLTGLTFAQAGGNGGTYIAAQYGTWNVPVTAGTTSGSSNQTFTLASGSYTLANGRQIAFAANQLIAFNDANPETGTISAVSSGCVARGYTSANPCVITISTSLSNGHGQGAQITSGTYGLDEAIIDANGNGGGLVVVDNNWKSLGGVSSTITTTAYGFAVVEIEDRRGNPLQIYQASGSGTGVYTVAFGISASGGAFGKLATNCGTATTCSSSSVTPTFVFGTTAASAASTATVLGMPAATTRAVCNVSDATNATAAKVTYSGTLLTLTTVATSSDTFNYNCTVF